MRITPKNVPIFQCIQINDNFFNLTEKDRPHFVNQLIELERFKIENNIASFKNETDQWINIPVNCFLIYDSKNFQLGMITEIQVKNDFKQIDYFDE